MYNWVPPPSLRMSKYTTEDISCHVPPDTSERAPPNLSQKGRYSIYLPRKDRRLS